LVLDGRDRIASGPQLRAIGLPGDEDYPIDEALEDLAQDAKDAFYALPSSDRESDGSVEAALSRALKKAAFRIWKRRPVVEATVLRV
jgi:ribonuclease J